MDEGENEISSKEVENMQPLSYFQDILNSYKLDEVLQDKALHFKYLLLAFMLLQPPLRTSFYSTAKIIFKKSMDNKEDNFILVDKDLNKITFIINHDKVSHPNTKEHEIPVKNKE